MPGCKERTPRFGLANDRFVHVVESCFSGDHSHLFRFCSQHVIILLENGIPPDLKIFCLQKYAFWAVRQVEGPLIVM
jgi:hypothetical protein